jgi:replicative DNA helicase
MQADNLFSREAEEGVLGAVLINPVTFTTLGLEPAHFFIQRHAFIWQAYARLYSAGTAIDFITLGDELERAGRLKEVGGPAFITQLVNLTPSSLHAADYAATIKDFAHRRSWRDTAGKIANLAFDKDSNLEVASGDIIDELLDAVKVDGAAVHISEYAAAVLEEAHERRANPGEIWGIPTGYVDFDKITGGLQLGEVLDVSGEPGVGKSIFAMQAGFQMALAESPGVIYSIEMKGEAVMRRRVSHDSKVTTRAIKSGQMDDQQFEKFLQVLGTYDDLPLYMSDAADITTSMLRADLSRLKIQHGIQWFVLDYAFLLRDGSGSGLQDWERTGLISARLKIICRALNLAGIVIHSMTKEGMNAVIPEGQHVRGSGQIFYDADVLMFMVNDDNDMRDNIVKCIFGKGRELARPKAYFELVRLPGFPALVNAEIRTERMEV